MIRPEYADEKLLEKGAKEAFILEKLGPGPELRNGPPGLRNLGATCYVSSTADELMTGKCIPSIVVQEYRLQEWSV